MSQQFAQPLSQAQAMQMNNARAANSTKAKEPVVFQNAIKSCGFLFSNGKKATFVSGEYVTDMQWEIDELMAEVNSGHPHISLSDKKVDKMAVEPVEALRKRIIAEYEEELKARNKDAGTSAPQALTPANSDTVAAGAAGSDSSNVGAAPAAAPAAVKVSLPAAK